MSADAGLAAVLAEGAGKLLLEVRSGTGPDGQPPAGGRELGRRGDGVANDYLLERLAAERPGDAVLSEESVDDSARLTGSRVWIIDPLDGSKEYGTPGREDWAVHVALWEKGRGITSAAVAQPALGKVYASHEAYDAQQHAAAVPPQPRIVVSGSRPPIFMDDVAAQLGAEVVTMGSAGAKAMAVVRGEVDAYVHAGGQWEWDSAAPVGVAQAAGLHCSRIDGSELVYNRPHPYLPDLVICRPEIASSLLAAIRTHAPDTADSARVAMAREYVGSLVSHDASKVRLAPDAWRVENGNRTGESGQEIRTELEQGEQYKPIRDIKALEFREWGPNVVARYTLDFGVSPSEVITVHVTEHFDIPGGEIASITAVIEPHERTEGGV
ncbi:MAG: 3'(2'),5'-bisphosphate nucleotidase CysQ [Rhodococcus sp.]|nr:3'(2'),5'-bisphosphate nucleotidase CysQ [Rhodococcus sp. (in: high G+C Gram-positive bacteria)]